MRITMKQNTHVSYDNGISMTLYEEGNVYDVPENIASSLINSKHAVEGSNAPQPKAKKVEVEETKVIQIETKEDVKEESENVKGTAKKKRGRPSKIEKEIENKGSE